MSHQAFGEPPVKSSTFSAIALAAASALALLAAPAFAQNYGDKTQYGDDETIIVVGPRLHGPGSDRDAATGAPIDTVTEQRVIETKDLDLRDDRDVHELYRRIDRTVAAACRSVQDRLDVPLDSNQTCMHDAREDALAQADRLIADARG
jgi:UrcA family protein